MVQPFETARITIVRQLDEDGDDLFAIAASRPDGEPLPVIESPGILMAAIIDQSTPIILQNIEAQEDEEDEEDEEEP